MKYRVRRALAAVAVLGSTLANSVASAPPAGASTSNTLYGNSSWRGSSFVWNHDSNLSRVFAAAYVQVPGQNCIDSGNTSVGEGPYAFAPGSTVSICLTGTEQYEQSFSLEAGWTGTTLTIRDFGSGSALGSGSYTLTKGNAATSVTDNNGDPTTTWYSNPITIRLDDGPMDASNGASRTGAFEMFISVGVDRFSGTDYSVDSRGVFNPPMAGTFPSVTYGQGYIDGHDGLMAGEDPNVGGVNGLALDGATVGKTMPVARLFSKYWNPPCSGSCLSGEADVDNYTAAGKLVMWSNKPHFTPTSGHSAWYDIANGTKDSDLNSQITTLANMATAPNAPGQAVLIFGHEPWGNSTDKGCTNISNPTSSGCYGSSLEFRAAFTRVKSRIVDLGKQNIVKLAYTEIDTKATKWGNDGISGGTSKVGGADVMYPGNPNRDCGLASGTQACSSATVDLLAHDIYNYYQYKAGGSGPPNYENGTWRSLEDRLLDTTSAGGAVGMGMIPLAKRLGKKLLIAELGSHPGCLSGDTAEGCDKSGRVLSEENGVPATRTEWFTNGVKAIETNTDALQHLLGWSYYHQVHTWDWRFISHGQQINPPVPDQTLDSFHQRGTGSTVWPGSGWKGGVVNGQLFKPNPVTIP